MHQGTHKNVLLWGAFSLAWLLLSEFSGAPRILPSGESDDSLQSFVSLLELPWGQGWAAHGDSLSVSGFAERLGPLGLGTTVSNPIYVHHS